VRDATRDVGVGTIDHEVEIVCSIGQGACVGISAELPGILAWVEP
jgi:hypothetical protein